MNGRNQDSGIWQAILLIAAMLLCFSVLPAQAAGLLTPADGSVAQLENHDHYASVVIDGGYAVTTVEQVFHNPHARDPEAI